MTPEAWEAERQIYLGTMLDLHDRLAQLVAVKRFNQRDELLARINVLERELRSAKQMISKYRNGKLRPRKRKA